LSEWRAYEKACGPLRTEYEGVLLKQIHELLQAANRMAGAQFDNNPMPIPSPAPVPSDVYADKPPIEEVAGGASDLDSFID
jgi:hypothetical protein